METVVFFVGKKVLEDGFSQVTGDGKTAFTMRQDQAEAMANVLLNEKFENQTYTFTNNETYSMHNVATVLTEFSGKEVVYTPVDLPTFEAQKAAEGLSPFVVKFIANFNIDIKNGQETVVTNDLETQLGRKPMTLKEGLKELFKL